jgi:hypothetical protein
MLAALLSAVLATGPCTGPDVRTLTDRRWLPGHFAAVPVVAGRQRQAIDRLGRDSLKITDRSFARVVTGKAALPKAKYYYLARAGYLGAWTSDFKRTNRDPQEISLDVKVTRNGVAYVTSSILSRDDGIGEVVVVLSSSKRLSGVVSSCTAAA